tara:strand:+ start:173 stop:1117 length:945 start_codon:yes stop_codon:yes gene_type:complete
MNKKAIIISVNGYKLTPDEKKLFKYEKPWGLILFKRNIKSFRQTKELIKKVRFLSKDKKFPILIDEEGISVTRLSNFYQNNLSQKLFGDIFDINPDISTNLYKNYIHSLSSVLRNLGININTVPVLDILRNRTHKVIGNRSFSKNSKIASVLGEVCVQQYKINNIATVIKHIPGHGYANVDSHMRLPKVNLNLKTLDKIDFLPFKKNSSLFAMTAHIIYSKIDKLNVATFSKKIISEIIRKKIGFKGILISDDISMKALKFDLIKNAKNSLLAGCNLVLYCSGNYKETYKLIKELPYIDKFTAKKTSEFYKFLR